MLLFSSLLSAQYGDSLLTVNLRPSGGLTKPDSRVDVDRDGLLDYAGVNDRGVYWIRNLGDGKLALPAYAQEADGVRRYAFTDWDGDGDPDVLQAKALGYWLELSWLENLGGRPVHWQHHVIDLPESFVVDRAIIDDLDGDGNLDLVGLANDLNYPRLQVLLGGGNGEFQTVWQQAERLPTELDVRNFELADMNGDGELDIFVTGFLRNPNRFAMGYFSWNGASLGDFTELHNYADYRIIHLADLNGDRLPDLYFSEPDSDRAIASLSSPVGYGADTVLQGVNVPFLLADVNNDGITDLLDERKLLHYASGFPDREGELRIRLGNDSLNPLSFAAPINTGLYTPASWEFFTRSYLQGDTFHLLGSFYQRLQLGYHDLAFLTEGDSLRVQAQLIEPNIVWSNVSVRHNFGRGERLIYPAPPAEGWPIFYEVREEIAGDPSYYRWREVFSPPFTPELAANDSIRLRVESDVGDLNGDNRKDFITQISQFSDGFGPDPVFHAWQRLSAAKGGWRSPTPIPEYQRESWGVRILPGDRGSISAVASELIIRSEGNGGVTHAVGIYRNEDRDGLPDDAQIIHFPARAPRSFQVGDGNADGYLDLVCGIDYTASYRFYFDPVTGNYPDTGNPFPSFVDFYAPYNFRDVTGDGKKDILGLSSGQLIYVDATDTTTVHNLAFIPGAYADFFRLTDWDHDGDLDLFTVTYDELAWFENEGDDFAGPYRKHELGDLDRGLPPGHRGGLSLGLDVQESGGKIDWDGDGDEDLFFRFFAFLPNLERDGSFEIGTYYDENENGRRDTSENWLVNTPITLTPPPVALRRFQSGSYLGFSAAEETHTVLVQPPTDWELVSDPPTVTVGQTVSPPAKYAIAVAPTSNDRKFGVEMTAGILRCNTVVPYWVNFTNLHATANPLTYLEVELEEGLSFANPPDSVVGNVGYFPVAPIKALQRRRLLIEVQAPGPEQIGGQLSVTARFPYQNGTQETVATTSLRSELRCSYDPNDKLVSPPGEKETSRVDYGTTLEYTIRFQNTGNDTAFLVTLLDTLDADLDYTSLRVRSASHPMTTDVDLERGIATFLFEDLELLAQTEDDAQSQGYVKFTIDHLPDLREHTDVHNRAAIYFDRNPPIITNDTYRQIRPGGDTSTTTREHFLPETAWKMYPNPATDFLRVEIEPAFFGDALMIDLLNVKGEVLRRYRGRLSNTLALPELPSGTYFLRLRNNGRVLGVRKLSLQR